MTEKRSLAERLKDTDIVGKLKPYNDQNQLKYSMLGAGEGIRFFQSVATDNPWLHISTNRMHNCAIWHSVFFGVWKLIPKYCRDHCWKLCATDRGMDAKGEKVDQLTMDEIMQIHEYQEEQGIQAKVGMDKRPYTKSIWGAYWYNGSKAEGMELYPVVREALDKINPDINLRLKRACTEFELFGGPTSRWDHVLEDDECEAVLEKWIDMVPLGNQSEGNELLINNTRNRFIDWAHQHGDMTYKLFTKGEPVTFDFPTVKTVPVEDSVCYNPKTGNPEE
jgi:hypothetical protein